MTSLIPLRNRSGEIVAHTVIDDADFERVSRHSWHLNEGYPSRSIRLIQNGVRVKRQERLHKFLLGLERGSRVEVDHIDRDKLNNRRDNLRVGTHAQNMENFPALGNGPRGATRLPNGRWRANCKGIHLGVFDTQQEAGEAAAEWRRTHLTFAESDS